MLKGIVFDLDGTVVDSLSTTLDAFNEGIQAVGLRRHTPEEIMKHFGAGEVDIFTQIVGSERALAAFEAYRAVLTDQMLTLPLHRGIAELLEQLKSAGVPISVFTGRGWNTTEMILQHHGLLDRFITVVAHDHVTRAKPSPEGLHLCLKRMRLEAPQVMLVGDSWQDVRAARDAGSQGVAALWDLLVRRDQLEAQDPHHWAEQPKHVWEIWQKLKA